MKIYESNNIRNICLMGHGGSGKTSLAEVMVFHSGAINRIGKVADGNTVSDYLQEEIQRRISISTSLVPVESNGVKINVLDTPGYADFIGEVISSMRVAETGVLVICGASGLEVQAEMIWDMMEEKKLPRIIYVNKMDRENAASEKILEELKQAYPQTHFVQMQIPVGKEENFKGIIDILQSQIPPEYSDEAEILKDTLLETVVEADDDILMKYLDGEQITDAELKTVLQKALAQNIIVPVLFGSAEKI